PSDESARPPPISQTYAHRAFSPRAASETRFTAWFHPISSRFFSGYPGFSIHVSPLREEGGLGRGQGPDAEVRRLSQEAPRTRGNRRDRARKKPQLRTVGVWVLVEAAGIEPACNLGRMRLSGRYPH